ncbi:hypothetical protein [uncultured Methanomethylovorans sp.]|uniref:hypothetical protein n=1 Tax=uncultured Methanomethylovorans sp. TaxID=183759 RepID=UPI002623207C|nr:hypothetical protein [uncultured Methanomethylovorans sp.]
MRSTDRRLIFLLAAVAIMCCMSVASACQICGYKYEKIGDQAVPVQGWTIYLYKMPLSGTGPVYVAQTTTGADGKYCFGEPPLSYGTFYVYEEVRPGWKQLYPETKFYTATFSAGDPNRVFTNMNFINQRDEVCYKGETAWATGPRYVTKGNWATYTPYAGETKTVKIYAGQTIEIGTATLAPVNGKVKITINLYGALFADVKENLKIQGYTAVPPAQNPAPGKFTTYKGTISGSSTTVIVDKFNFYGIHLDVKVPC